MISKALASVDNPEVTPGSAPNKSPASLTSNAGQLGQVESNVTCGDDVSSHGQRQGHLRDG